VDVKTLRSALALNLSLGCLLAVGWQFIAVGQAAAASAKYGNCQSIRLPVALAPGDPANQAIAGMYCVPVRWASGPHEVDVMTPGATYNSAYWDWPQNPALYSYVDKTLQAGRAALDYNRLGTGNSSRPPSAALAVSDEAYVLHQLVAWLRGSRGYSQVNLIGHSLGSVISIQEAGLYQDVSRVVVTGLLHPPNAGVGFATTLLSLLHPAALDPQFLGLGFDLGYLTTIPSDRAADFYSAAADPAVVTYDEAHKDVVPMTDLTSLSTTWALPSGPNVSDSVTAPVLIVIGAQDAIFCTAPPVLDCSQTAELLASEEPYYTSAASLTIDSISGTGHDIALHPSADQSFALINQWITTH
jgi:pimeloyl-ACP methyl ester carboxylesterase